MTLTAPLADHDDVERLAQLSGRFRRFALNHALPTGPLYSRLALGVAEDASLLHLAGQAASTPMTNLFFAAVHDLLLRGIDHPLALFYPNLTPDARRPDEALPAFRSFCHEYEEQIVRVLQTRRVQTNEVRRCLYLAPAFELIAREAGAYSVVDVGASAGLHLLWPRYGYDYEGHRLGDVSSPVQLTCRFDGPFRPSLPETWSEPSTQVGIDLRPLDPRKADDEIWLRALVWPEHAERAALLANALTIAREHPPRVEVGDVFDRLPALLDEGPSDSVWCLCHNHTANQWSGADRDRFDALLFQLARDRTFYRLSAEWVSTDAPELVLSRYGNGDVSHRLLARVDDHGAWIEWRTTSTGAATPLR